MTSDAHSKTRPSISGIAHVIERIGLAIIGAICGLFVTALLAKANADALSSVGLAFAMILCGVIGFYVGIDIPRRTSGTTWIDLSKVGLGPNADLAELLSAVGILLAAVAVLASVYAVVFDEVVPAIWIVAVGASWLIGVALQITAGVIGHIRDRTDVVDRNRYFSPEHMRREFLAPSDHYTTCAWKGAATYYHVVVDGLENRESARCYPDPKPAKNSSGKIAF